MKTILMIALILQFLNASELEIVSQSYKGDQKKGISVFSGNVKVKKGKDTLSAQEIVIYTDSSNKPNKLVADGGVAFFIVTEGNASYKGNAMRVVYLPNEQEYQFYENVHLLELSEKKEIKGEKIIVNMLSGEASASGASKEPVKMIFQLKDK
jgi:lipopolysaccharide export system protein LptA